MWFYKAPPKKTDEYNERKRVHARVSLSGAFYFGKCLLFVSHKYTYGSYNGWGVY